MRRCPQGYIDGVMKRLTVHPGYSRSPVAFLPLRICTVRDLTVCPGLLRPNSLWPDLLPYGEPRLGWGETTGSCSRALAVLVPERVTMGPSSSRAPAVLVFARAPPSGLAFAG